MSTIVSRDPDSNHGAEANRMQGADALLLFAVATAILMLKAPEALTHPQFWAEDGRYLFQQQYGSWIPQLHVTIAGYLVVTQRLVAWVAAMLSNIHAPLIYNTSAILIGAVSLASLRRLPLDRSVLWILLASVALTPTNGEIFGTLTNVQWFTQLYLLVPVARFLNNEQPPRRLFAYAGIIIVGLSGPFAAFALAAAAGGWLTLWLASRRNAHSSPIRMPRPTVEIMLLVACAIVQSYLVATHKPTVLLPTLVALLQIGTSLQVHTLGGMWIPTAAFCLLTLAAAAVAIWSADSKQGRAMTVAAASFIAAELWTVACQQSLMPVPANLALADRYYFFFKIAFWVCLALALRASARRYAHAVQPAILVAMAVVAVANFSNLFRHQFVDLDWRRYAVRMDRGEAVTVPINPPPWGFSVSERAQ